MIFLINFFNLSIKQNKTKGQKEAYARGLGGPTCLGIKHIGLPTQLMHLGVTLFSIF
jgi:hypothetical protein